MSKRKRRVVASALAAIALTMVAQPVIAQAKTDGGVNYLSPLKAAARAASRQLWGYMHYAKQWPTASRQYGFMSFDAATASNFTDLRTESERTLVPNGGSAYINGKYNLLNYKTNAGQGSITLTYYQFDTNRNWASVYAPETVGDLSLIATETAVSQYTGKVYGQFYTSDMASFEFGVIDYENMERTTIAPSTHKYVAMGVSSEERVYGVSTDGNLYEINTTTGEETKIGSTGVYVAPSSEKSYGQSGEIDQDDDTFYWASFDANQQGALYTVDLTTGRATLIANFPHNEQIYGLAIPETTPADDAPAAPTAVSVTFENGSTTGWLTLNTPSKTYGGGELTGTLNYSVRSGKKELLTGTIPANSSTSVKLTAPEGMNYFAVTLSNAAGKSKATTTSAYVGYDQPKQVSYARLKIDASTGKATVQWGSPSGTVNGGYLGTLTYDIVRYPEAVKVASGIGGTSFTEKITDKQLRNYYYGVTPINGSKRGPERLTAPVSYGDNIEPPYTETFATENDFDLFTTIDANSDGNTWTWHESNKCAQYEASDTKTADDWLVSPPVQLRGNHSYTVSFSARNAMATFAEKIEARWGNQPTVAAMNNIVAEETRLTDSSTPTILQKTFSVSADQILYLGIHAISSANTAKIFVDNITITDNGCLEGPAAVENLTVTPDPTAALKSTVSFRLPTKNVAGSTVAAITKVVVERDGNIVKTFGASTAGQTLTCEDNSPAEGFNNYTVTPYTAAGAGTATTLKAYIGLDVPSDVEGVKLADNKTNFTISWDETSARGKNGGAVIKSDVDYNVFRVRNVEGSVSQQLISTQKTTSFTDNVNTNEGAQELRMYALTAKNTKGESSQVMTPVAIIGAPYTLPFTSGFAEEENAPLWWSLTGDAENGRGFVQNTQTSSDGDNNCLVFTAYSNGATADITTGKIALGGVANPVVIFSHSGTADKNIVLNVYAAMPGGAEQLLGTVDYSSVEGKADDWHRTMFKIPSSMSTADYVTLTFKASANLYGILKLDNVVVRNAYSDDLAVGLKAAATMKRGATGTATVTVTNNGENAAKGYRVMLTAGGQTVLDQTIDESLASLASKTFNVEVASDVNSSSENFRLHANVEYAADKYAADNTADFIVKLTESGIPTPENFDANKDEEAHTLTMTWTTPAPASVRTYDTFEKYDNWTIDQFGEWTTYSPNKGNTTGGWWGPMGMPFPHETEKYVYIVFNPEAIQSGITATNSSIKPHSGEKALMSMYSREGSTFLDTDDWLISPMLSGEAQEVSVWAVNAQPDMNNKRYPQTVEILYSDKTADHADFQKVKTFTVSGGAWDMYSAEIPDGANYFAVRCNTTEKDAYCLLLDDISYYAGYGKLQGYHVYRNGEIIDTLPADATTTTITYDPEAPATRYSLSAVFTGGESAAVSNDNCQTDISSVVVDANSPADVYTLDGKLVVKSATSLRMLKSGVYVVNGKKVVIR